MPAAFLKWLFPAERASRLAWVVSAVAVVIGLRLAFFPWSGLAGLERPLFEPVPFLRFLDRVPPVGVLVAVQVAGLAGVLVALATGGGRARQVGFVLAWVAYLILAGFRASRGKIQHNDLLVVSAAVPFLFAPAAAYRGSGPQWCGRRYGWPIRVATVMVATSYFCTGLRKLQYAGLEWVTGDTMRWIMHAGASSRQSPFPGVARFVAESPILFHLAAGSVLAFEVTFPLVLCWRRARPVFVALAVAFHTGTWVTLGLDYWNYAALAAVLLLGWTDHAAAVRMRNLYARGAGSRRAIRRRV